MQIEAKYFKSKGFYIEPEKIKRGSRIREHSSKSDVEALKTSIIELGQLQPVILTREKELIAGGSRVKACEDLSRKVWAVYTDELDEITLKKIQLHENTKRANLTAPEELLLKEEIFNLMLARTGGLATQADFAKELQQSVGLISEDLKLASYIKQLPEFFSDCESKAEIRKKAKRMEQRAEEFILQKAADRMSEDSIGKLSTITGVSHQALEKEKELFDATKESSIKGKENYIRGKIKEYNERLYLGDWQEGLEKVKDESIDLMLLDPPWGIEIQEKQEAKFLDGRGYNDSEKQFLKDFPELIKLCYSKMRKDGHLYCFFAIKHYAFVWQTLQEPFSPDDKRGFHGIDRPIVIYKEGRGSGRQGNHWPVSSYEMLALFKKGTRQLNVGGVSDVQVVPWINPSEKRGHISAKPSEVYRRILSWSARPGDTVCDPTFGSGAAFLACEEMSHLKLNWFGWDNDPGCRRLALMNLTNFQVTLMDEQERESPLEVRGPKIYRGDFKPEQVPETYIGLTPGSTEWKSYWNTHKEDQEEMLAYAAKRKEVTDNG